MVQTRANRGAADPPGDSARSARLTRRRAATDDTTERVLPSAAKLSRAKGKGASVPSSIASDDEDSEEEEQSEEEEEEIEAKGEPVARFGAPRGKLVKDISPPPQSESELGSQSVSLTQRFNDHYNNAQYTRYSSVPRPLEPRSQADQLRGSYREDEDETEGKSQDADIHELAEIREAALDSLWKTTESFAKLLIEPKPESRAWASLLSIQRNNWKNIQNLFTDHDSDLLINLPEVLVTLDEELHSQGRVVIAAANVTAVQNELLNITLRKKDPLDLLERLDMDFPVPFMTYVPDNPAEAITDEVVELALNIRTQRLIALLKALDLGDDRQSPAAFAAPLFCSPLDDSVDPEEALRHGPHTSICGITTARVKEWALAIVPLFEDKTVAEALYALEDTFPFKNEDGSGFLGKISEWVLEVVGDAKDYMKPPLSVRGSSPTDSLASSVPRQVVRKNLHEDIISRSSVHHLAKLIREPRPSQPARSPSLTPNPKRVATAEADPGPQKEAEDAVDEDDAGAIAFARGTQPPQPQPQPQPEAGPSTAPQQRFGFTPVNGSSSTNKRPIDAPSQSQDDDDAFEQDDREPDPQRREQLDRDRRDMPPPATRPAKRQRLPSRPSPTRPSSSRAPPASSLSSSSSSAPPPPSTNPSRTAGPHGTPPHSPDTSPTPSSSAATTTASSFSFSQIREQNRKAPSGTPRPQQRVPWSDRDVGRLVRLIEYHNCVWAKIARRQHPEGRLGEPGPEDTEDCVFEHPRDQQAIRDKARNLKVDLLKGDYPLYAGFDSIALGKKERSVLIARGKNPYRLEEDVDINGVPINTQYVPRAGEEVEEEE